MMVLPRTRLSKTVTKTTAVCGGCASSEMRRYAMSIAQVAKSKWAIAFFFAAAFAGTVLLANSIGQSPTADEIALQGP
jgi:hypothetical protein